MSQPFDRGARLPPPGEIDAELGEFWEDPWTISQKQNLSFYERNRTFLNISGDQFLDISYLSGADSDGDARAVVAADLNHDGRLELIVRQVGGGPLKIFENRFPPQNFLKVSLRGGKSNRLGIGARLVAVIGERRIVRDMYPINSFRSQAPNIVHFGLGAADVIDELLVDWPSGETNRLVGIRSNQHLLVSEEDAQTQLVRPGRLTPP